MDYRIAVCDDSPADRAYGAELVSRWAAQRGLGIRLETFPSAEQLWFHHGEGDRWDILLLDIEMGDMDGVTLAKKLRSVHETVEIIFLTGYSDYISEGYEVAALHYLMKPVKEEKLFSVLDRAAEKRLQNRKVLTLQTQEGTVRLPVYQIRWAEVRLNYVTVHGLSDITVRMTLGELSQLLDDRFYRVGRSLVVNLTRIVRVTRQEIVLENGESLPLPRGAYEGINRAIISLR